jgi:hypothetical protein
VYEGASFNPKPSEYELFLKKLIEQNDPKIQPYKDCLPNIKNCLADFNKSKNYNSSYYSNDGLINNVLNCDFDVDNISKFLNVSSTNYTCPNSLENDLSNKLFQLVVKDLKNESVSLLNQLNKKLKNDFLKPKPPGKNNEDTHYKSILFGDKSDTLISISNIKSIKQYISENNITFTKEKYLILVNQIIYIVQFLIDVNKKISFGDFVKNTTIQILPILQINIIKRKLKL